jgi:hypothetical protein
MSSRIVLSGVLWLVSAALPAALYAQDLTDNPGVAAQPNAAKPIVPEIKKDPAELQSSSDAPSSPPQSSSKSSERIFGVVPAYNITDAQNAPPLTPGEKFGLFAKGTLDPFPFVAYALQAGVSQASDTHNGYGQGLGGYGKRFGAACLDGTSARFFGTYAFPSLLHQDPRYFRKGQGSAWSRVRYSITRGFVTRADSGKPQPNWSNLFGKFTAAGLSNAYYPAEDRGANLTLTRVAISLGYQTLGNLAIEFWPEIHRKLSGSNKSK